MVARINALKSISKVLNYNEQKVQAGNAELLHASSFLKDAADLTFYNKLQHFERLHSLNEKVVTNTLHVSLNFDPSEQISNEKLVKIAAAYMDGIGFGNQPYLVYRHEDAGHPHIHIVSTNIQRDGSRISMHNLGRNQSEISRKQIEIDFGLVKASDKALYGASVLSAVDARKITYGKGTTRQAISNVLRLVIDGYKYTSLEQLNAVLKLYNVVADKGEPGSRLEQFRGLQYQVLDEGGNRVGVPLNSSRFFMKPTLAYLEKKFDQNKELKGPLKKRLQTILDWEIGRRGGNLASFTRGLEKESISVVLRHTKEGALYGVTYIDLKARAVFNGSEIGKAYSAKGLQEYFSAAISKPTQVETQKTASSKDSKQSQHSRDFHPFQSDSNKPNVLETLIEPEWGTDIVPAPLKRKPKKKKRKLL
jgi:hypothetical protein